MSHRSIVTLTLTSALTVGLGACETEGTAPVEDTPLISVAGAEARGETFAIQIDGATPDPPIRGDVNAWTFTLLRADTPVAGCTFEVEPTMPAHGHGTNPNPSVTDLGDGRYEMRPLNFIMPGQWHISVRPNCDGQSDTLLLVVDIQS